MTLVKGGGEGERNLGTAALFWSVSPSSFWVLGGRRGGRILTQSGQKRKKGEKKRG